MTSDSVTDASSGRRRNDGEQSARGDQNVQIREVGAGAQIRVNINSPSVNLVGADDYVTAMEHWIDQRRGLGIGIPVPNLSEECRPTAVRIQRLLSLEGDPRIRALSAERVDVWRDISALPRLTLAGPALAGKTYSLLSMVLQSVARYKANPYPVVMQREVPFLIRGATIAGRTPVDRAILRSISDYKITRTAVQSFLSTPEIAPIFFVDGVDEAPDRGAMTDLLSELTAFAHARVIITTRLTFTEALPGGLENSVYLLLPPSKKALARIAVDVAKQAGGKETVTVNSAQDASLLDTVGGACLLGLWLAEFGQQSPAVPTRSQLIDDLLRLRCIREIRRRTPKDPDTAVERFNVKWPHVASRLGDAAIAAILAIPGRLADDAEPRRVGLNLDKVSALAVQWLNLTESAPAGTFSHRAFGEHLAARRLAEQGPDVLLHAVERYLLGSPGTRRLFSTALIQSEARDTLLLRAVAADREWPNETDVALERSMLGLNVAIESRPSDWLPTSRKIIQRCIARAIAARAWGDLSSVSVDWWTQAHLDELMSEVRWDLSAPAMSLLLRVGADRRAALIRMLFENLEQDLNTIATSKLIIALGVDARYRARLLTLLTRNAIEEDHPNAAASAVEIIRQNWNNKSGEYALDRLARRAVSPVGWQRAIIALSALAITGDQEQRDRVLGRLRRLRDSKLTNRGVRFSAALAVHQVGGDDLSALRPLARTSSPDTVTCWALAALARSGEADAVDTLRALSISAEESLVRSTASELLTQMRSDQSGESEARESTPGALPVAELDETLALRLLSTDDLDMHTRADLLLRLLAGPTNDTAALVRDLALTPRFHAHLRNVLAASVVDGKFEMSNKHVTLMLMQNLTLEDVHIHSAIDSMELLQAIAPRSIWIEAACERLKRTAEDSFFTHVALNKLASLGGLTAAKAICDVLSSVEFHLPEHLDALRWALSSARRECSTIEWFDLVSRAQHATMAVLSTVEWSELARASDG